MLKNVWTHKIRYLSRIRTDVITQSRRDVGHRYFHSSNIRYNERLRESTPSTENHILVTLGDIRESPSDNNETATTNINTEEIEHDTVIPDEGVESQEEAPVGPYVDTYKTYNRLRLAGFTGAQADVIIDVLQRNIAYSMDKVNKKYVPQTDLENETYLFESAQSELRLDIQNSRDSAQNGIRNLMHIYEREFNTISDDLNENFLTSKNDSQVLINEQKSENTLLQKSLRIKIQELDNKISTELNSGIKSDIEGLRWHTTRSGLLAILVLVFCILSGFQLNKRQQNAAEFIPLKVIAPSDLEAEEDESYREDFEKVST